MRGRQAIRQETAARSAAAEPRDRDEAFFLETEALGAALAAAREILLRVPADADAPALLVEGESGAGRSTFLNRLAQISPEACCVALRHPTGEAALLGHLARAFGLGGEDDADALATHIAARADKASPLVLVDDADHLSLFALRALIDLRRAVWRRGGHLGVVISAAPDVVPRVLALPSFSAFRDTFHRITLPRFGEEETRELLQRAFSGDEGQGADETQLRLVSRAGAGLPGRIMRAVEELRRGGNPRPYRRTRRVHALAPRKNWLLPAAGVGALLIAGAYLAHSVLLGTPADNGMHTTALPMATVRIADAPAPVSVPVPAPTPAPVVEPSPPPVAVSEPPVPPVRATTPPSVSPASVPAVTRPSADAGLNGRAWLMAQESKRYTIQLASAPDQTRADEFITKHPLGGKTVAVETQRGGQAWYIILHGSFATQAEAQRAIGTLPPALVKNDPFARRMESVQAIAVGG